MSKQPFRRVLANASDLPPAVETDFEKQRGVFEVELRTGFARAHVYEMAEPLTESRTTVLQSVADAKISIDFLKLTSDGLSFVVAAEKQAEAEAALKKAGAKFEMVPDRCVLSVSSPNLRDEEGLAARLVATVLGSKARLDHMSDMHDRVLFLLDKPDAERAAKAIEAFQAEVAG